MDVVTLVELLLGPLMLARVPTLQAAPGGVVVRPDAPKLDMAVVVDAEPDAAAIKPLVASLTGQRPQPASLVIAAGATAPDDVAIVVDIEPAITLASPEALDRIAAALAHDDAIAVYPWQKTATRYEALSTFFVLASAMTTGAFTVLPLRPRRIPTGLRAQKSDASGTTTPKVYGGGHIVAERRFDNGVRDLVDGWVGRISQTRTAHPLALLAAIAYFYGAAAVAIRFFVDPSWTTFAWYAAYVFSISICLRQVGKYARMATAIYPVTLAFFLLIALASSLTLRRQRARAAKAASR